MIASLYFEASTEVEVDAVTLPQTHPLPLREGVGGGEMGAESLSREKARR
jgi:hypothetical protein